jgi:hypothetical protein
MLQKAISFFLHLPLKGDVKETKKTAETKFMKHTALYRLLNHRRNEDILEEIKVDPA